MHLYHTVFSGMLTFHKNIAAATVASNLILAHDSVQASVPTILIPQAQSMHIQLSG